MLRWLGGTGWRSHSAHWVGFKVAALIALISAVAAITRANWAYIRPVSPGRNAAGMNTAIAAKAPMTVTGTVVAGTSVARQSCRNTTMTISTRIAASESVLYTSSIEVLTNLVVSNGIA